ncbi:glycoside hydrolase family 97 catalytic domain-containing protein [Labilibaculum manganireducens]|uniref:glycoside hydrolase family 97 protein n=1 Tax=Labilibaculum manganireducens TaxID=1940525 RepID=UPI0029F4F4FF|nr:glycoside hydrolase family 97 catalytic domain-containing protein [Labilibaculum manganireducens]
MKKYIIVYVLMLLSISLFSQEYKAISPDGKLGVSVLVKDGKPVYTVNYNGILMLDDSPLGLITNVGDFSQEMELMATDYGKIDKKYTQDRIKKSTVIYQANELTVALSNKKGQKIEIIFRVSNNDIAFRYQLPQYGNSKSCVVEKEVTGFNFPNKTTTFLTPQATPMIGWERTKPSYEEEYIPDEPMGTSSKYGQGYTFPSLFHIGSDGWVLVSETGVSSSYCASHLSEGTSDGLYSIRFPDLGENNGIGSAAPAFSLPNFTPWRTITVSDDLKQIVETTIPFDVVEPLYEPSLEYKYGRSTWSWIMWQDESMNYDDQVTYIDLAAEMGYEYILMDAMWDTQVGYDRMPSLIKYAQSKGVDVFLWYNSNGYWNDAPQGPKNKMNNTIIRKKEMKWLQSLGVKGLKIDFFGGDKQESMKLYEDILSDANDYGLMIVFHGTTLPRGWERMYPNFVGSEAVRASENLIFQQHANDMEAYNACLHPFIRNAVGSMEFGPVLLNKRHNRNNDGGNIRRTSDVFQLATAVLYQNPVQMFAIAPNNLTDVPAFEIEFMKEVPTTWDETVFIDGYPGKYCILARRHASKWYVVGVNAEHEPLNIEVELPMLAGKLITRYGDNKDFVPFKDNISIKKTGKIQLTIQAKGGIILTN